MWLFPARLYSHCMLLATTHSGTYTLTATDLDIPAGAELYFEDRQTEQRLLIDSSFEYTFTSEGMHDEFAKAAPGNSNGIIPCSSSPVKAKADGSDRFVITSVPGDNLPETGELPTQTSLEQNFPNPFNPSTVIRYNLAETSDVQLNVFDMLGRRVATLVEGTLSAGAHTVNFDASGLNSGVYFYRLTAQNQVHSKQMILVK